jgi:hypothetical protein
MNNAKFPTQSVSFVLHSECCDDGTVIGHAPLRSRTQAVPDVRRLRIRFPDLPLQIKSVPNLIWWKEIAEQSS